MKFLRPGAIMGVGNDVVGFDVGIEVGRVKVFEFSDARLIEMFVNELL